jgi:cytochrome c553
VAKHDSRRRARTRRPPGLAGRSPSYLARQIWDIKTGSRRGPAVALMQAPVAQLNEADIVDITAYLASRRP